MLLYPKLTLTTVCGINSKETQINLILTVSMLQKTSLLGFFCLFFVFLPLHFVLDETLAKDDQSLHLRGGL